MVSTDELITLIALVLIAVFSSITAPILISARAQKQQQQENQRLEILHKQEKEEDWKRQDEVAARLAEKQVATVRETAETSAKLLAAQQATIARTDEVARLAAEANAVNSAKLDQIDAQAKQIHILVNSDMTAARQSELDQTRAMLVVLERVVALREAGVPPAESDVVAIGRAQARISELEQILADRLEQFQKAESEAAAATTPIAE